MTRAGASVRDLRSAPAVRKIVRDWRRLGEEAGVAPRRAGDARRRTLIACSGGADSSGLAIALAAGCSTPRRTLVLAHIVHDLRPPEQAHADRDAAASLADRLSIPFAQASVTVREGRGNAEARARRERYRALRRLAAEHRCPVVATAHHAQDQLETILMALVRGAGARGMSGVRPWRTLGPGAVLMRPALGVERSGLRALCEQAGHAWREDATNADLSRLRARVRHTVVPLLTDLRPGVAARAARSAELLGGAAAIVGAAAAELRAMAAAAETAPGIWLDRALLASAPPVVVGVVVRECLSELGLAGLDAMGSRAITPLIRAVRDGAADPRIFRVGPVGITVTARRVRLESPNDQPGERGGGRSMADHVSVLLVGHCGPDSYALKSAVGRAVPGARVEFVHDRATLDLKLAAADLVLVNRLLDGDFGADGGIELIGALAPASRAAFLLISNYPDAQAAALRAGAAPGFGKAELNSPAARDRLLAALAARQRAS